ncbi:MAG: hypothetical protein ACTSSQ_05685 [Alphaproteobacteria bacterium]
MGGKIASTSNLSARPMKDAATRKETFEKSLGWNAGITADMFS